MSDHSKLSLEFKIMFNSTNKYAKKVPKSTCNRPRVGLFRFTTMAPLIAKVSKHNFEFFAIKVVGQTIFYHNKKVVVKWNYQVRSSQFSVLYCKFNHMKC